MALFGKKEAAAKSPGGDPPQKKEAGGEQPQTVPKGKAKTRAKDSSLQTTYLGKNLKINGNISGEGRVIILGTFEGAFDLKGQLEIARGAVIKGDIQATDVSINGKLEGSVVASERILLDKTAAIKGRLATPKISIHDGAVFDGELRMSPEPDPKPRTPEAG